MHASEKKGELGLPNFLEEDYLEALAVRRYLTMKDFLEENKVEDWKLHEKWQFIILIRE